MTKTVKIEKELDKHKKGELAELCASVGMETHNKKAVMVNRLRYSIEQGALVSKFDEPAYDSEIEANATPAKKEKEVKPEPVYNWEESPYEGRQVYTSAGTGNIVKQTPENNPDGNFFLVKLQDGTEKAVNEDTTRFKAVNDAYRDKYIKDESIRTESGAPSTHSGNDVSYALLGTTLSELQGVAKENGLVDTYNGYLNREKPLNAGMVRMNLGNILIARVRRGEEVSIFGEKDLGQAVKKGQARAQELARLEKERKAEQKKVREAKAKKKAEDKAFKVAKAKAKKTA